MWHIPSHRQNVNSVDHVAQWYRNDTVVTGADLIATDYPID
jgi:hypothetical protein